MTKDERIRWLLAEVERLRAERDAARLARRTLEERVRRVLDADWVPTVRMDG